jgi:hypothetical protein
MGYDRRTILGLVGAGVGLGAAGSTQADWLRSSTAEEEEPSRRATDAPTEAEVSRQTTDGDAEATTSALSARTDDVLDELAWFAGDYDDAIDAYLTAADTVLTTVSEHGQTVQLSDSVVERLDGETDQPRLDRGWPYDVWWEEGERRWRYVDIEWQQPTDEVEDETPLPESAIADLRDVTTAFVETFETELTPHFSGAGAEASFATNTIDTIAEFNGRGDIVMVVAGLVRLYQHYDALSSPAYVDGSLSDAPIRNRLAGYLESPVSVSTTPLFEVDYRDGVDNHQAFVYDDSVGQGRRDELYDGEPLATIDGATGDTGRTRLQNVVSELGVDAGRLDRCYVLVNEWERPRSNYYSDELSSQSIFVQRYESETAAGDAYQGLLDREDITPANVDVELGSSVPEAWTPVYFPHEGQPWSAAMRRTGRHLLVAGAARRPLQQRDEDVVGDDWTDPLRLSWVWEDGEAGGRS